MLIGEFLFAMEIDQTIEVKIQRSNDQGDLCPDDGDDQQKRARQANAVLHHDK